MASSPIISWQIDGDTVKTVADFIFLVSKITADGDCSYEIKRYLLLGRKVMTNLDSILKNIHCFSNKGPSSQGYGFPSSHVWVWELDHKESWEPKNWCFWTVVLEMTLESPLDCKEIQPVHPKGDQSWGFIGRTILKLKLQSFGHVMWRADSFEKTLMLGKTGQEEKGTTEDEVVGWHHQLNGHEFGWTLEVGDRQGALVCCGSWGLRVRHDWVTELTDWLIWKLIIKVERNPHWHTIFKRAISKKDIEPTCLRSHNSPKYIQCTILLANIEFG